MFKSVALIYQAALNNAGYKHKQVYTPVVATEKKKNKNKRKQRNICWFNPPFSQNVKTNVGANFFKLVNKHFPKSNPLNKVINRNTVKMSYKCTENMAKIIASHNSKLLKSENENEARGCNCRNKEECPLRGNCLVENVVYQATLTPTPDPAGDPPAPHDREPQTYVGLASTSFKDRHRNHKKSLKWEKHSTETRLSQYSWELNKKNIEHSITWKVIDRGQQFSPVSGLCSLCTTEKYYIIFKPEMSSLNSREEIFGHCLHKKPKLLDKIDKT